jgi:hypothetical protein
MLWHAYLSASQNNNPPIDHQVEFQRFSRDHRDSVCMHPPGNLWISPHCNDGPRRVCGPFLLSLVWSHSDVSFV